MTTTTTTTGTQPAQPVPRPAGASSRFAERARRERRRRWLRRLAVLLAVALVAGAVWAAGWSGLLGVRQVQVDGRHRTTLPAVLAAAAVPSAQPMLRVDLAGIRHRVEALPTVQSARVTRVWPHTVAITLTERQPVAVVHRGSGLRVIAADGVDFADAPADTSRPLLDLDVAAATRERVTTGLAVITQLPDALLHEVTAVRVYAPTDVRLLLHDGRHVYWGSPARTQDKAQVLAALEAQDPKARVLDVSAPDAPTVRS